MDQSFANSSKSLRVAIVDSAMRNGDGKSFELKGGVSSVSRDIERLSHELADISKRLGTVGLDHIAPMQSGRVANDSDLADRVRSTIRSRQLRFKHFPTELFADPAWDMLLDLFESELRQRRTTVTSLCVASQVPTTTALRWIRTLTDSNFFTRHKDPLDGRRIYVELTCGTSAELRSYFEKIAA